MHYQRFRVSLCSSTRALFWMSGLEQGEESHFFKNAFRLVKVVGISLWPPDQTLKNCKRGLDRKLAPESGLPGRVGPRTKMIKIVRSVCAFITVVGYRSNFCELAEGRSQRRCGGAEETQRRSSLRRCTLACTRFRGHRVRCFDGAGGGSWRDGSLPASSSLRLCA